MTAKLNPNGQYLGSTLPHAQVRRHRPLSEGEVKNRAGLQLESGKNARIPIHVASTPNSLNSNKAKT